jgi:hydrogenase-4 component E
LTPTLNLLVGLAVGLNLLALGSSRVPSMIRAVALQGMVLGVLPILAGHESNWVAVLVALATMAIKGYLIPSLLRRALRAANVDREIKPLIGFVPSLLLGAAATGGAVALAGVLPLRPEHAHSLLVPGAFATVICGFLLIMGRSTALAQVCGYLVLENGIFMAGLLLLGAVPLMVEGGILLDLTVAVFVIGIFVDRIQREFDTLDTRKLTTLRE